MNTKQEELEENIVNKEASEEDALETDTSSESKNDTASDAQEDDIEEQLKNTHEKLARQIAETENLRRRYEKQLEEAREYSVVAFAKDLLSVTDSLGRALEHEVTDASEEVNALISGVKMTRDEMYKIFEKHGVVEVAPAQGDIFDYNLHYAISYEETNSFAPGQIAGIMQFGYKIKDRLLRPAIVTVAKEPESKEKTDA